VSVWTAAANLPPGRPRAADAIVGTMAGDPARTIDPRFPNLRPEVVAGYLSAPEHVVAEVLDGELSLMPRPRRQHAHAATRLSRRLGAFSDPIGDEPGGWIVFVEPELHLGPKPDIVVPDVAGWRRARVPEDFLAPSAPAHVDLAPDWVCEVLSPRTEADDRGRKMRIYRREAVAYVWLVDPDIRTLEVFRLEGGRYAMLDAYEGDAVVRAEPFDAVEIPLAALWNL
jgi:Uma2 family endonuclease